MPEAPEVTGQLFKIEPPFADPFRRALFSALSRPLSRILRLDSLNAAYTAVTRHGASDNFLDNLLDYLRVSYSVDDLGLSRIPASGPVLVVANHPFGAIEGVILASLLRKVRPDSCLMANYLLGLIPEMRPYLRLVDPFGTDASAKKNIGPLKDCLRWLKDGHMLGVFPAGEVAALDLRQRRVAEPAWSPTVARMARVAKASVLPIHFQGGNGLLFNLAGLVHPRLRTALLPHEMLNKRDRTVSIRVGGLIPPEHLADLGDDRQVIDYLRFRTFALGDPKPRRLLPAPRPRRLPAVPASQAPLADPMDPALLRREVEALAPEQILVESGAFAVFHHSREQAPALFLEIARLREKTFRAVGEGTGAPLDQDRFDDHYVHLTLWNRDAGEVVGGYRLGRTDEIISRLGPHGLYTSTLFTYKKSLLDQIDPALELGRSFVREEYQKSYSSLLLLWKGIGQYVLRNPRYKTLFGPVSISNDYRSVSREIMVRCLKEHSSLPALSRLVKPKTPPKLKFLKKMGLSSLPLSAIKDLEAMTSLISGIEADNKGIPVLLRQYLRLGGKILAFNVDAEFSDCLDGLILVDLAQTDLKVLGRYMGRQEALAFQALHDKSGPDDVSRCA